jgi:sulfite reductase alpha subunit-like flavoprotein
LSLAVVIVVVLSLAVVVVVVVVTRFFPPHILERHMSSLSPQRKEQVLVLFASQTGNSEQAALEIADQLPGKLSTEKLLVTSRHMQLDDFLELHQAEWTRLVVIVTSSYGVGQAPLGGYRFRDFCNALLLLHVEEEEEEKRTTTTNSGRKKMLEGLSFCLLGLGDSKYTTFFRNPTVTDKALQAVGATRVGDLGKADASSVDPDQLAVIGHWVDGIWPELQEIVKQPPLSEDRLKEMQRDTIQLCRELDPDFMPEPKQDTFAGTFFMSTYAILVALLGVVAWYFLTLKNEDIHDTVKTQT